MKKLIAAVLLFALVLSSCNLLGDGGESSGTDISETISETDVSSADVSVPEESAEESNEPVSYFVKGDTVHDNGFEYDFDPSPAVNEFAAVVSFVNYLYGRGEYHYVPHEGAAEGEVNSPFDGASASDKFTFMYIDLESGCSFGYGADTIYQTCSVIKPSLAVFILRSGADLSEEITIKKYYGGSGVLTKADVGKAFSAEYLISIMITESDNTAYIHLLQHYGQQAFSDYLSSIGNENTNVGAPTWYKFGLISTRDLAVMMLDVYNYSLESDSGAWVMELMCNTSYNELITAAGLKWKIAHKYGEDNGIEPSLHDAAIVLADRPYILVICSKSDVNGAYSYNVFSELTFLIDNFNDAMHGGNR